LQLVKKFPAFHGTRRFITALTSVRHLSLSWASPIQSIYPHQTSCRFILILPTHLRLRLPSALLPSGFPSKTLYTPSTLPYASHAQPISFFSILSPAQYLVRSTMSSTKHLREKGRTHCIGVWVGPRAGLDWREKSRHHQDSIPRQCSVVLITESGPLLLRN